MRIAEGLAASNDPSGGENWGKIQPGRTEVDGEAMKGMDCHRAYRRWAGFLCAVILLWMSSGCGYHLADGEDNIDPAIQKVFVDTFTNRTHEAGIENLVRSAFMDQVLRGGRFQLAGSREEADALIRGDIRSLSTSHLSYGKTDLSVEERITVVLDVTFEERTSKRILWQVRNFNYYNDYTVAGEQTNVMEIKRKSALVKLSGDAAERAYSLILSGF